MAAILGFTINDGVVTGYVQNNTLRIHDTIRGRQTAELVLLDDDGGLTAPVDGQQLKVFDNTGSVIWGGYLTRVGRRILQGTTDKIEYTCHAVDYSVLLDRHVIGARAWSSVTLYAAVRELWEYQVELNQSLIHDGVTINNVENPGPTIDRYLIREPRSVGTVLSDISLLTGRSFYVDQDKDLHVFEFQENAAPFDLTDASGNFRDLVITGDNTRKRNRQYIVGPSELFPSRSEEFVGDGFTRDFHTTLPLSGTPTITIADHKTYTADAPTEVLTLAGHGVSNGETVYPWNTGGAVDTGLTEGSSYTVESATTNTLKLTGVDIQGDGTGTNTLSRYSSETGARTVGVFEVDTGYDWYWLTGTTAIHQDVGGAVLRTDETMTIVYQEIGGNVTVTSDDDDISDTAAEEGGSGVYEDVVTVTEADTTDYLDDLAAAYLRKYGTKPNEVEYETDSVVQASVWNLRAGQFQNVNSTYYDFSDDILIEEIEWFDVDGQMLKGIVRGIDAGESYEGWREFFGNGSSSSSGFTSAITAAENSLAAFAGRKFTGSITAAGQELTSDDAQFTSDDVGKLCVLTGAGANATFFGTSIQAVIDASTATVADAASTTVSDGVAAIGPDAKAALNDKMVTLSDSTYAAVDENAGIGSGSLRSVVLEIPAGVFLVSGSVELNIHSRVIGDSRSTVELWNTSDDFTFEYLSNVGSDQWGFETGFRLENLTIFAKNGIKINREFADHDTQPGNAGTDYDYQAFILGVIIRQVMVVGEYNAALDANFDTSTAPTLAELRGYGVGLHMNKVFDGEVSMSEFKQVGVGIIMTGCDVNLVSACRLHQNARHLHEVFIELRQTGSSNILQGCDILINHRVGGVYLDRCTHKTMINNFFENSVGSATYITTVKDIFTRISGNRFNNPGQVSLPWAEFDPRWGCEVTNNTWNPSNVRNSPATVGQTYASTSFREQMRFSGNDAAMRLPSGPGVRKRPYDRYLVDYANNRGTSEGKEDGYLDGYMFAANNWATNAAGRWVLRTESGSALYLIFKVETPAHNRFMASYWGTQITASGGVSTGYFEDVGVTTVDDGTDIFTRTGHLLSDDDQIRFRSTETLPAGITSAVTNYYVINATANTFKISLTEGGGAVDITDQGTGTFYTQHWDQLFSIAGNPYTSTTTPTLYEHTLRIPPDRRGDGWFQLFIDADAYNESVVVRPIDHEYVTSEPVVLDDYQSGDRFWNKDLAGVEPVEWIYTNDDEMRPGFRLGGCADVDFVSTTPITLTADDGIVTVDTTVGDITVNLPPQTSGKWFIVQNRSGANDVIITADGSDVIDGSATFTLHNRASPYHQTAIIIGIGGSNWTALKLGEQVDRVILGNPSDYAYIEVVTTSPSGSLARPAGSVALDETNGDMWFKQTGAGTSGWALVTIGMWTFEDTDTIATEFNVHLTDTSDSRPMNFVVTANAHASQAATPLINAGKLNAMTWGVGVGTSTQSGSEELNVANAARLAGAVKLAAKTGPAPLYIDSSEDIQTGTVASNDIMRWSGSVVNGMTYAELWSAMLTSIGAATMRGNLDASSDTHTHTGTANISISGTTGITDGHSHSFSDTDSDPFSTSTPVE